MRYAHNGGHGQREVRRRDGVSAHVLPHGAADGPFHIEDYVCTSCGGLLTEEDVRKIKERRVRAYFRDVSDNVIRINDLVDTLRFREVKSEE